MMHLKHPGMLCSEILPKHEGMKEKFKTNPKLAQEMRNYSWEHFCDYSHCRGYYKKYRRHGQFNGKKPRKRESIRRARQIKQRYKDELVNQLKNDILDELV